MSEGRNKLVSSGDAYTEKKCHGMVTSSRVPTMNVKASNINEHQQQHVIFLLLT